MHIPEKTYPRRLIVTLLIILTAWIVREVMFPGFPWYRHFIGTVVLTLLVQLVWTTYARLHRAFNQAGFFSSRVYLRLTVQLMSGLLIVLSMHFLFLALIGNRIPFLVENVTRGVMLISDILLSLAINMTFISDYLISRWKESIVRAERLEKENAQMQYHHLKNQVDPHFLFNTLTALDSLVKSDPELASQFIGHLSKVYRYVLQHKDKEVVSLETELAFIHHYCALLRIRFREGLRVNIHVSESAKERGIAIVTLQMLIDNAIKHNEIHAAHPLHIDIYDCEDDLYVRNNKRAKGQMHSNKQGLQQLVQLYAFLSSRPVEVSDAMDHFTVKLPLL